MDREYRITIQEPCTSGAEKDTDWDKCVICQQITIEALKCPTASKRNIDGAGYRTLADNLLAFKEIDCLPSNMFPWLKDGQDSEETLQSHKAKWHDSCRLQYNKSKLKRAAKRKALPADSEGVPIKKYICASIQPSVETEHCFFVKNQRSYRSPYIKHQHLVLMPVSDNVHYSCKTKVY